MGNFRCYLIFLNHLSHERHYESVCGTRSGSRAEPRCLEINLDLSDTWQSVPARTDPPPAGLGGCGRCSRVLQPGPALTERSRTFSVTVHRPDRRGDLLFLLVSRSPLGFISLDNWRQACVWKNVALFSFTLAGRLFKPERLQDYVCARFDTHTCKYKNSWHA